MRLPTLLLLLLSVVLLGEMHAASAQSPTSYAWCSRSDDNNYNICYFTSREQCQETTAGGSAFCFANPTYRPSPRASDQAMNAPRLGPPANNEAVNAPRLGEPNRQVARVAQVRQSAPTRERSPSNRPDAGAAEPQAPKQETQSFTDIIAAGVARVVSSAIDEVGMPRF